MNDSNISDMLFSKARQRVLGLLYSHPNKNFYTNEIIRTTNMGTGVIQRELEKLTATGLILVKKIGNQKHYQANKSTPLYDELCSIILKTFGLPEIIRKALTSLSANIQIAFIYGSIAKKEDTLMSDIDLMLIGNDLTYADFFALIQDAESQLGRKINPTFYTPSSWHRKCRAKNHFLLKVIIEPKIFLIGTEIELKKLK